VALKRFLANDGQNNGRLYLSYRDARLVLRSNPTQIARWYRELEFYGFIRKTTEGCLGVNGRGVSPHWRLTEIAYMREPATKDFLNWDGREYRDQKTKSHSRKQERSAPENGSIPVLRKTGALKVQNAPETGSIERAQTTPENGSISSSTTPPAPRGGTIPISPELTAIMRRRVGAP
jgi:hypothetical protein